MTWFLLGQDFSWVLMDPFSKILYRRGGESKEEGRLADKRLVSLSFLCACYLSKWLTESIK